MRRVARFQVASVDFRVEHPELATGIHATRITALVGIATRDGLDDLALAARMSALGTLDAFSRFLCALSAVEALRCTAEEHESHQEVAIHLGGGSCYPEVGMSDAPRPLLEQGCQLGGQPSKRGLIDFARTRALPTQASDAPQAPS